MRNVYVLVLFILASLVAVQDVFAFEVDLDASGTASTETTNSLYGTADVRVSHEASGFKFLWDLAATNDRVYEAVFGGEYSYGSTSFLIKEGGLSWSSGAFALALGKHVLRDEIDSPYSLALSSAGNAALTASLRYEDDRFFFSDRWLALNYDSDQSFGSSTVAWPDRSVVLKSYGIKGGEFRFGFQDISVYTDLEYGSAQRGPLFDLEYFLNPAPGFFIQYADTSMDSPWKKSGALDDNSILGFFGEWKHGAYAADAQFLVDDINMNRFINPSAYQNPDKLAWTVGGSMETDYGTFRLDHAGATKYMYEPSGYSSVNNNCYGYTYYPSTEYLLNGSYTAIDSETNYVGYINGENNAALMASWSNRYGLLSAKASLELKLTGSQSPCNPWHEYVSYSDGGQGTKWLEEDLLEKRLVAKGRCEYALGDLTLYAAGTLGYVWNKLKLTLVPGEVEDSIGNGIPIFKPSSEDAVVASLTLGGSWALKY